MPSNPQEFTLISAKCMVYGHDYNDDGTCKRPSCSVGLENPYAK